MVIYISIHRRADTGMAWCMRFLVLFAVLVILAELALLIYLAVINKDVLFKCTLSHFKCHHMMYHFVLHLLIIVTALDHLMVARGRGFCSKLCFSLFQREIC